VRECAHEREEREGGRGREREVGREGGREGEGGRGREGGKETIEKEGGREGGREGEPRLWRPREILGGHNRRGHNSPWARVRY
jgi:hypothetical protein